MRFDLRGAAPGDGGELGGLGWGLGFVGKNGREGSREGAGERARRESGSRASWGPYPREWGARRHGDSTVRWRRASSATATHAFGRYRGGRR